MIHVVKTIDAHTGGQPLRLVVEGMPRPQGTTMLRKQQWMLRQADALRRAVMLEPRGHRDMSGAIFTDPTSPGAHAGLLFMHNDGYAALCGHGLIAAVTIAVERQLIFDRAADDLSEPVFVLDTVAGTVQARARTVRQGDRRRVDAVAFTAPPSFVSAAGHLVKLEGMGRLKPAPTTIHVDIAFGGGFYAIVDTEAIGLPLDRTALPSLRRIASGIREALDGSPAVVHPVDAGYSGLEGVVFTGPPRDPEAHLRNVTVFADEAVDRSPCGAGTAAVMAVLDAMGLLIDDGPFVHESIIGTRFRGRLMRRTQVGELPAIIPEIEGSACITGEHTFLLDDDDPLKEGYSL